MKASHEEDTSIGRGDNNLYVNLILIYAGELSADSFSGRVLYVCLGSG